MSFKTQSKKFETQFEVSKPFTAPVSKSIGSLIIVKPRLKIKSLSKHDLKSKSVEFRFEANSVTKFDRIQITIESEFQTKSALNFDLKPNQS